MRLKDIKKRLRQEAESYVPDVLHKVKPSSHDLPTYQEHVEVVKHPKEKTPFWTKRFALQLTSMVLITILSVSIILGSLNPQEAVMSKQEFETVMSDVISVEVNLWDYLPVVLSPKEVVEPTSYQEMVNLVGRPDLANRPDMNENERLASRQLTYIQDIIQAVDTELSRMNEFNQNRQTLLEKATAEFSRRRGRSHITFDVNDRRIDVVVESKEKLTLSANLSFASYDLTYEQVENQRHYKGTIDYAGGQRIEFSLSEQVQEIKLTGLEHAKVLTFTQNNLVTVGELLEYTLVEGEFQLTNKGMIQVDNDYTYVITDYPLLEEQTETLVYEVEVYHNETGDFVLSKIVIGELEVYRFDFNFLDGFESVTFHQIGAGVNARKEFRVDGIKFIDTEDYAIAHRALAIRTIGNARFGLTRYVLVPYLLVEKSYYEDSSLPTPFIGGDVDIAHLIVKIETLDAMYQMMMSENHSFES